MNPYDDIIRLPHSQSTRRRMPLYERAAQFAPFAALTGYEALIGEEARLTDSRPIPCSEDAQLINERLNRIIESGEPVAVRLTYFVPDGRKRGGKLIKKEGAARRVDSVLKKLIFTDKSEINTDDIISLDITGEA